MKFGSNDKILDWHLLTKDEAEAYVYFLGDERARHIEAIGDAQEEIGEINWCGSSHPVDVASKRLYASAIRRHEKDIIEIDRLVEMVSHWFKL